MTAQEVINRIQQFIVENNNNEITAAVLRPILEDMVLQPNSLIGDLSSLNTEQSANLVEAINFVLSKTGNNGITIHTGTSNPNTNPPSAYELGDFYKLLVDGVMAGFYIFNGVIWVLVDEPPLAMYKEIRTTSNSYEFTEDDYTVIYVGTVVNTFTLPPTSESINRIVRIVNKSVVTLNLNLTYKDKGVGTGTSSVPPETAVELHCNGTSWYQIN